MQQQVLQFYLNHHQSDVVFKQLYPESFLCRRKLRKTK